jgi:hypothetical protein
MKSHNEIRKLSIGVFSTLFILLITTQTFAQRKNLILDQGFESGGAIRDMFPGREIDGSGSLTVVDSPVRAGKKSCKVITKGVRTEVKYNGAGGSNIPNGKERWFGFSVYFPNEFVTTTTSGGGVDIIFQIHERPDSCENWRSPPFAVYGRDNKLEISVIPDPNACSKGNPGNVEGKGNKKLIYSTPFIRGRWVDMVLHVRWAHDEAGDGLTEAWIDGKKVVSYKGPNCYNDQKEMYWKMGLYHHDDMLHTHYMDELRIGNQNATYSDVAPGTGTTPSEPTKGQATINLMKGWNLMSLPLQPSDTSINSVLKDILGKYMAIYAYEAGNYLSYIPGETPNSLSTIEPGRGYWIYMEEAGSIQLQGEVASKTISLREGWNLSGLNTTNTIPVTNAFSSITSKISVVYGFDNSSNSYKGYIPTETSNELNELVPGRGYWIYTTEDSSWILS